MVSPEHAGRVIVQVVPSGAMSSACVVSHGAPVHVATSVFGSDGSTTTWIVPSVTDPPSPGLPDSALTNVPDRSTMSIEASCPWCSIRLTWIVAGEAGGALGRRVGLALGGAEGATVGEPDGAADDVGA